MRHSGINDTLVILQDKYWILRGRQTVKWILKACVLCQRMEGSPYYSTQTPTDLPVCHVLDDPPFTHVGLDFAGPLYVKDGVHLSEEGTRKTYIIIMSFTCTSTRAIHLELTAGLNVETFLLAFHRFTS